MFLLWKNKIARRLISISKSNKFRSNFTSEFPLTTKLGIKVSVSDSTTFLSFLFVDKLARASTIYFAMYSSTFIELLIRNVNALVELIKSLIELRPFCMRLCFK